MSNYTGIVGGVGSGKTIYLVSEMHKYWLRGRRVISNLRLHFPVVNSLTAPEQFKLLDLVRYMDNPKEWDNIYLALDEIYVYLEARLSGGNELNRVASYFIFQSRKRRVKIDWTSQKFGTPDNRLRWSTLEVGELIKTLGVYVYCRLIHSRINAVQCWKRRCPHLNDCKLTQNFQLRYAKWKGRKWRKYRMNYVQQYFDLYETEQVIDYNETLLVQAYLQARNRKLKKMVKEKVTEMLTEIPVKDFMKELEAVLQE